MNDSSIDLVRGDVVSRKSSELKPSSRGSIQPDGPKQEKKISQYIDEAMAESSQSKSGSGGSSSDDESVDCVSRKSKSMSRSDNDSVSMAS